MFHLDDYMINDLSRFIFIFGVILSLLIFQKFQVVPGGLIIPGYLAFSLFRPLNILFTIIIAILTNILFEQVRKRNFLSKSDRYRLNLAIGVLLSLVWFFIRFLIVRQTNIEEIVIESAGLLIPGIVSYKIVSQGVKKTVTAILGVTGIMWAVLLLMSRILPLLREDIALVRDASELSWAFNPNLLLLASLLSMALSVFFTKKFQIRTGGVICSAFIAALILRPIDLLFFGVVSLLTYFITTRFLVEMDFMFGQKKFAYTMLFAFIIGWSIDLFLQHTTGGLVAIGQGLTIIQLIIPAMIANDMEIQGIKKTAIGVFGSTTMVLVFMLIVSGIAQIAS